MSVNVFIHHNVISVEIMLQISTHYFVLAKFLRLQPYLFQLTIKLKHRKIVKIHLHALNQDTRNKKFEDYDKALLIFLV